jgi:hypothetical protein
VRCTHTVAAGCIATQRLRRNTAQHDIGCGRGIRRDPSRPDARVWVTPGRDAHAAVAATPRWTRSFASGSSSSAINVVPQFWHAERAAMTGRSNGNRATNTSSKLPTNDASTSSAASAADRLRTTRIPASRMRRSVRSQTCYLPRTSCETQCGDRFAGSRASTQTLSSDQAMTEIAGLLVDNRQCDGRMVERSLRVAWDTGRRLSGPSWQRAMHPQDATGRQALDGGKFALHSNEDNLSAADLALGYEPLQRSQVTWRMPPVGGACLARSRTIGAPGLPGGLPS